MVEMKFWREERGGRIEVFDEEADILTPSSFIAMRNNKKRQVDCVEVGRGAPGVQTQKACEAGVGAREETVIRAPSVCARAVLMRRRGPMLDKSHFYGALYKLHSDPWVNT